MKREKRIFVTSFLLQRLLLVWTQLKESKKKSTEKLHLAFSVGYIYIYIYIYVIFFLLLLLPFSHSQVTCK